jgi:hypothetical protein
MSTFSMEHQQEKKMELKLNPDIIRQGDVTLVRVAKTAVPKWAREVKADDKADGKVVVEYGESSGHGHRIADKGVLGFRAETAEMAALAGLDVVLVGGAGAVMRHEYADGRHAEHDPVTMREGVWERAVQVEYDPEEERRVAD